MSNERSLRPRAALLALLLLAFAVAAQTDLTVTNGSKNIGKGRSGLAHIWADPAPPNMVFDKWTGDTALIGDIFSAHALVNPLSKKISVKATYKPAPEWNFTAETINGTDVVYYLPKDPVGVIFRFHGSGGNVQSVLFSVESRIFSNDAAAAGFGIVAVNSVDRTTGNWSLSLPPNNPDITNIGAIIATLRSRGLIAADTPLLAQGTSRGGAFSSEAAYFLNFRATAIYIAFGINAVMQKTGVPTIFCMAANDDQELVGPEGNQTAYTQFLDLQERGIAADYYLNQPSPVYPERFWRIPGLNADDSRSIYAVLKDEGFLDARDLLTESPRESDWRDVLPAEYERFEDAVASELGAAYANHNFYSDCDSRVLRFFSESLSSPAAERKKMRIP